MTAASMRHSPIRGYQFAMGEAEKGLQRGAAAQGTLLTGGTLKDLASLDTNLADQNYQNVYNNAAQTYASNYNTAAQQYNQSYQQYLNGLQNALSIYGENQNVNQQSWNNAFNLSNQGFAENYSLANLGLQAAGGANAAGANYGANAGNQLTGIGNAQAAGQVGSANAWNNGLGNLANLADYGLYNGSLYNNKGSQPNYSGGGGNYGPGY